MIVVVLEMMVDESGERTRDGEVVSLPEVKKNFPLLIESFAPVRKIFTQVTHKKDSQTAGSVNNNVWDSAVTANDRLYEYGKDGRSYGYCSGH